MITLQKARELLPKEEQGIGDAELSSLLASLYGFADLVCDIVLEKRKAGDVRC